MEHVVFIVFAALVAVSASAQVGELSLRAKEKGIASGGFSAFYINGDTTSILVELNTSSVNARYDLVRMDLNQKELARVSYRRAEGRHYVDGFDNPGSVDLLVTEHNKSETELKVLHERRDVTTLAELGDPRLLKVLTGEKRDKMGFIYRTSPNKQLGCGVYIKQREGEGAEAEAVLYNREFEPYWSMTTHLRALDFVRVTDSGEVVIGGWGQKEKDDEAFFEVIVLDGEEDHTYHFSTKSGELMEVQFANYANHKVYLFAIVREKKNRSNGTQVDRLLSLCYNTANSTLTEEMHTLTTQEVNRLYNNSDNSHAKSAVQFLQIDGVAAAPDGHYEAVLSQRWTEVDKYGFPSAYFTQGLMLVTVDKEGHFARTNPRRMYTGVPVAQYQMNRLLPMRTSHGSVLFYIENASSYQRPLNEGTKRFQPILKSGVMTVVYTPDEGEPVVQHFQTAKNGIMGLPKHIDDNTFILFLRDRSKAQLGVFTMDAGL